jgi:uncharacterized protein (TIGR02996 family)
MQRPDPAAPSADWLVYADWLQQANDPRGELISLVHHGADPDKFVHKHAEALLGPAAKAYRQNAYRIAWRHCFADRVEVRVTCDTAQGAGHWTKVILESPAAEHLRELAIVGVTDDRKPCDLSPAIGILKDTPLPDTCTSIAIIDDRATRSRTQIAREYGTDENLVHITTLEPIWKPPIEHVRLELADAHSIAFGAIDGRRLRSLTLRCLRFQHGDDSNIAASLRGVAWDRLEELELRLAETFSSNIPLERDPYVAVYSDDPEDEHHRYAEEADDGDSLGLNFGELEPMFAKLVRAPLRRLALTSTASPDDLIAMLARTGLPPTLRVLDLSDSAFTRRHVQLLRKHAKLLAPLTELVLERTSIEPAWLSELQGLGPTIRHSYSESAPTYRYVVGME